MPSANSNKHLTLEERRIIETGIRNGSTHTAIANILGKDKSTIGREIKQHRELQYKCHLPLECKNYQKCYHGRHCETTCVDYVPFQCNRRDKSPGACNGCTKYSGCRFSKYRYNPELADSAYKDLLSGCRAGVNMTCKEAEQLGDLVAPLIKQGLSPYQIVTIHPELDICERTLYNYVSMGLFRKQGICDVNLRQKSKRKPMPKKDAEKYKKRNDYKYLKGRLYSDYLLYMKENPHAEVVEMDTVYNSIGDGPFLQTFKFVKYGFLFAILHSEITADSMLNGVRLLEAILGEELFLKYVNVLLTDRGHEFSAANEMEIGENGILRTRVFYCNPMSPGQKGSLENKHKELRYILPKKTDLFQLGLTDQDKLNLVLSHVNSAVQEHLNGKSPFEYLAFMAPDLCERMIDFGVTPIKDKDTVVLKPYLIK